MNAKLEDVSRRALLSLLGLGSAFLVGSTVIGVSDAEAQTVGMERRQERRVNRRERREDRRIGRQERREDRRTGRAQRREDRRGY